MNAHHITDEQIKTVRAVLAALLGEPDRTLEQRPNRYRLAREAYELLGDLSAAPQGEPKLPDGVTLEDLLIPLRAALNTCHDTDWSLRQFKTHITHALAALQSAQPAPAVPSDERAAFEAWARPHGYDLRRNAALGHHSSLDTLRAWEGWQARAALTAAPTPPAQSGIRAEFVDAHIQRTAQTVGSMVAETADKRGADAVAEFVRQAMRHVLSLIDAFPPAQPAVPESAVDEATIADHQEALRSVYALVRRLDIALNGEAGASPQARLCDIVSQVEARQQPAVPMTDEQATLLNQAHDMLLTHADYQRSRGNDSEAKGAECSADAVLKLAAAWASAPAVPESADPFLVRDIAEMIGSSVPDVCKALVELGYPQRSTNMEIPRPEAVAVAQRLRTAVPEDVARIKAALYIAMDALDEIALAGMSGTGQESEEAMRDWHARRAWEFIGIAARARDAARAAGKGGTA